MPDLPLMYEPTDPRPRPVIAVNAPIWDNLLYDLRVTIEHDPERGEVRVIGDYGYVLAEAVA